MNIKLVKIAKFSRKVAKIDLPENETFAKIWLRSGRILTSIWPKIHS